MPASNPIVLDNLFRLRAIDLTNVFTGTTLVVKSPGAGLPPCSYTLLDSTLPDYEPIVITPVLGGTRKWICHNNVVVRETAPTLVPLFIDLVFINSVSRNIFISINTTAVGDWFSVRGGGAGATTVT
jgi:hypothetical protein